MREKSLDQSQVMLLMTWPYLWTSLIHQAPERFYWQAHATLFERLLLVSIITKHVWWLSVLLSTLDMAQTNLAWVFFRNQNKTFQFLEIKINPYGQGQSWSRVRGRVQTTWTEFLAILNLLSLCRHFYLIAVIKCCGHFSNSRSPLFVHVVCARPCGQFSDIIDSPFSFVDHFIK